MVQVHEKQSSGSKLLDVFGKGAPMPHSNLAYRLLGKRDRFRYCEERGLVAAGVERESS
jgi:hypothetical protein